MPSDPDGLIKLIQGLTLVDGESGIRAELGVELKRSYVVYRQDEFGEQTHRLWDCRRGQMFALKNSASQISHSYNLALFCNKPTTFYLARSAQTDDHCPLLIFGCIYKKWFRHNHPSIEFGHFFANPFRITVTGPTTISGIAEAHRSLCDQASQLLRKIEWGEIGKLHQSAWPNTRDFKLLPMYRAIIVILDELPLDKVVASDGSIPLDEIMQRENVVLVLTGDDSGLSTPVTFESLIPRSLPLARVDWTASGNDIDAIRVPLALAVRFVADPERREQAAYPATRPIAVDKSIYPLPVFNGSPVLSGDEWANEIIKEAVQKGKENVHQTRDALRRIKTSFSLRRLRMIDILALASLPKLSVTFGLLRPSSGKLECGEMTRVLSLMACQSRRKAFKELIAQSLQLANTGMHGFLISASSSFSSFRVTLMKMRNHGSAERISYYKE